MVEWDTLYTLRQFSYWLRHTVEKVLNRLELIPAINYCWARLTSSSLNLPFVVLGLHYNVASYLQPSTIYLAVPGFPDASWRRMGGSWGGRFLPADLVRHLNKQHASDLILLQIKIRKTTSMQCAVQYLWWGDGGDSLHKSVVRGDGDFTGFWGILIRTVSSLWGYEYTVHSTHHILWISTCLALLVINKITDLWFPLLGYYLKPFL
jgi:hypothetical protein